MAKWSDKYNIVLRGTKAVIDRDFFPTCIPSQLDDEWAARTVHFRPFFEPTAMESGIVNQDHACGKNTPANVAMWKKMAHNVILGKTYREYMINGWNTALQELTQEKEKSESHGNSKFVPDFSFGDNRPYSQEDVRKILFGETVVGMVKENDLEEPLALLFMWGYYLTMQGYSLDWANKTTDTYINDKKIQHSALDRMFGE